MWGGDIPPLPSPHPTLLPKMADAAVTVVSLKMRFEVEGRLKEDPNKALFVGSI